MSEPVYLGMPVTDRTFTTPFGEIRCGGPCRDNYLRIRHYAQTAGATVTLQLAALESFKAAELAITPHWMRRRHKVRHISLTGSARSCSSQTALWLSDKARFAEPASSAHCRALAIDVSMAQSWWRRRKIGKALAARGWHQARPSDEPWHWSYGIQC